MNKIKIKKLGQPKPLPKIIQEATSKYIYENKKMPLFQENIFVCYGISNKISSKNDHL